MKFKILLLCFLLQFTIKAQNITQAEYYLDSDPGRGNGTSINLTPSADISLSIPLSTFSKGFHVLYVRVKDSLNNWSLSQCQPVYNDNITVQPNNISQLEYFLDTDPGAGNGTSISFTPGLDVTVNLPVNTINKGFHVLYIRAKDSNGTWSISQIAPFYNDNIVVLPNNISRLEYFLDTDPGAGNGTSIAFTPGLDVTVNLPVNTINKGFHELVIRARDANGHWSFIQSTPFYNDNMVALPNIKKAEYFFDIDPGFGNGIDISIIASSNINQGFVASLNSLSLGTHKIYLRVKDSLNHWSFSQTDSFVICNLPATSSISGKINYCIGDTIKLNGTSVSGANGYLWKGPNNFISNNLNLQLNNASAAMAGTYSLITIRSGGTSCDTSAPATVNVNVNPLPASQSLSLNGVLNFCSGDSVTLSTTYQTGYSYRWLLNGSNTAIANDTMNSLIVKSGGTYNVLVTNQNRCSSMMHDTIVTTFPKPLTSVITGNTNVTGGTVQTYSVANTSGSTYNWTINNGTINSGNGSNSIVVQWQSISGTGSLKVMETNNNGCKGDTVSRNIAVTMGIETLNMSSNVRVYPNPSNGVFIIEFKNLHGNKNIQLFDVAGKMIQQVKTLKDELQMSIDGLARGTYLLKIVTEEGMGTSKIILE